MTNDEIMGLGRVVAHGMAEIAATQAELPDGLNVDEWSMTFDWKPTGESWKISVAREP